ncbi:hypothetical protein SFC12_04420 [Lactococcus lactis]|uniref:hypothetical protein n=1 Tax=Lactococcus lactis TaxID=1358 RepID=UPI003981A7A8
MDDEVKAYQVLTNKRERILQDKYYRFNKRVNEIEGEIRIPPFGNLSDIKGWAEVVQSFVKKITVMQNYSIEQSKKAWSEFENDTLERVMKNREYSLILARHAVFLSRLDGLYKERMRKFAENLDISVRNLRRYTSDLEENSISLSGVLAESKSLYELNWLKVL